LRVEEGSLVERRCPDCGNLERRAFGETESRRGELASYALGWTSGHETRVGHLTIGIGAGNPGGASFHIDVWTGDESWVMGLVDKPFEDVPQGGPDLTREEALGHADIAYVWFVADNVMEEDRRALWMQHWLWQTPASVTDGVLAEMAPVREVVRDKEGDWILRDGSPDDDELRVLHLFHAIDRDVSLLEVLNLPPAQRARREAVGSRWKRKPI
jgi:hypothetical protein